MQDGPVYRLKDGVTFVAHHGEEGWVRWPAEAGGWDRRWSCRESDADGAEELPPRLAWLAFRLSGAPEGCADEPDAGLP
jgi:hypothetical protein